MAARKFSRAVPRAVRNPKPDSKIQDRSVPMPIQELRFTVLRLRQARCLVTTAAGALAHQNADADADIACVLQHSLGAILLSEITRFETLLAGRRP